jgi:predicted transposase YbfD/YdcC
MESKKATKAVNVNPEPKKLETTTILSMKFQIKAILCDNRVSMKRPTLYRKHKICMKLLGVFQGCQDTRVKGRCTYSMPDLILMMFLAIVAGADNPIEIALFWESEDIYRLYCKVFKYDRVPSHDTFLRILAIINPSELNALLVYAQELRDKAIRKALGLEEAEKKTVIMDGKVMRGTSRKGGTNEEIKATQVLNAMSYDSETCILSIAIENKSNEVPAVREAIKSLMDVNNVVFTFDSLHTNRETALLILSLKGDFVGGLKGNQPKFNEFAKGKFTDEYMEKVRNDSTLHVYSSEISHNQFELREFYLYNLASVDKRGPFLEWQGVETITCMKKRTCNNVTGEKTEEIRYYLSTLKDVELIAKTIRSHWAIENNMHWELDTVMKEDECAFTNKTAALNWSILSKVSLSFLRRYQQLLGNTAPSKKGLRKQMGWSFESMLSTVLLMMDADELSSALTLVPKESKG